MAYSKVLDDMKAAIESITADPPWRYSHDQDVRDLPEGSYAQRRYQLEDPSDIYVGPMLGFDQDRYEVRYVDVVTRYFKGESRLDLEKLISDDTDAMNNVIYDIRTADTLAVLYDGKTDIERTDPAWLVTRRYKAIVEV